MRPITFALLSSSLLEPCSALIRPSSEFFEAASSWAPWYCPPVEAEAQLCVQQHRMGKWPLFVEETLAPMSVRTLVQLMEDPSVARNWTGPAQILLELIDGIRLLVCHTRFQLCYVEASLAERQRQLCEFIDARQQLVEQFDGVTRLVCPVLFHEGDASVLLEAVSKPLQGVVARAFPEAAPPALGNYGSRFDYEHFFAASGESTARQGRQGRELQPLTLSISSDLSPDGKCDGAAAMEDVAMEPDAVLALDLLRRAGVPLSNFVINFGAADGACGGRRDWNYDPANCMAEAGNAALLVEGNPRWRPDLLRRFGARNDVFINFDYLPLHDVHQLLSKSLAALQLKAESPDLLKIDIDHADCRYMEEALAVARPKIIHFEYWPLVPPPIDYAQQYQAPILKVGLYELPKPLLAAEERRGGPGGEPSGCSLAGFMSRLSGYTLIAVGQEEALVARDDMLEALARSGMSSSSGLFKPLRDVESAWLQGAFCHPLHGRAAGTFEWGFDFRVLSEPRLSLSERADMLRSLLQAHGASGFDISIPEEPG
eukprot:TRINITY_DN46913_c0_g2_i1.p1 TRINITY_DN46913_c0_g2~~TRINITY_DN46913_c0_g2_i1.p1  ORF type:complete len:543 (-),score=117.88 TRINITY_DN46913_c0_g2_i1:540-2168(-)